MSQAVAASSCSAAPCPMDTRISTDVVTDATTMGGMQAMRRADCCPVYSCSKCNETLSDEERVYWFAIGNTSGHGRCCEPNDYNAIKRQMEEQQQLKQACRHPEASVRSLSVTGLFEQMHCDACNVSFERMTDAGIRQMDSYGQPRICQHDDPFFDDDNTGTWHCDDCGSTDIPAPKRRR